MRSYLDCIPCFFRQALEAARLAGADKAVQKKIIDRLSLEIPKFSFEKSPPEMADTVYGLVRELTGKADPFSEIKKKSNEMAVSLYPVLKKKVAGSHDRLLAACKVAIAGNIIDLGAKHSLSIDEEIKKILEKDFNACTDHEDSIFDFEEFKSALNKAKSVLYLGDNSGEVVFDRVLIEEIKAPVTYAVREKPVINDALIEDAIRCGVDKAARVISSGSDIPGIILSRCTAEFLDFYKKADMVISKGQGNFESLEDRSKRIFYMFRVKCPVVAEHVRCEVGDIILMDNSKHPTSDF